MLGRGRIYCRYVPMMKIACGVRAWTGRPRGNRFYRSGSHLIGLQFRLLAFAFLAAASIGAADDPYARAINESLRAKQAGVAVQQAPAQSKPSEGEAAVIGARIKEAVDGVARARVARQVPPAPPLAAQNAGGGKAEVRLRPGNKTVLQIKGAMLEEAAQGAFFANAGGRNEHTARQFLRRERALLRLQDPDGELKLLGQDKDELGHRLRFRQEYRGIPVWPSGLRVHLDPQGNVNLVDGAYAPTPAEADLTPKITADEAVRRASKVLSRGENPEATVPELIIYAPLEGKSRLAWRFDLQRGLVESWRFVVDASNGRVLHRSNRIHDTGADGSGVDLTGATRSLKVWEQAGTYYLSDTSKQMFKPGFDPLQDPRGVITVSDARGKQVNELFDGAIFHITSSSANLWDIPAGVSAAFNFSQTYDYFMERHSRDSIDGRGGNVTAIVRVGNYANASWHGNLQLMLFGEVKPYAACLDVVGHELTHGITENSAGLIYENQSGALNEAFSDIFGEMVEARARGQNDWFMASELDAPIRNMKNPGSINIPGLGRPYPSKMSEFVVLPNTRDGDHGGVHINSSIINHAFYLLAEGLPAAIGRQSAERIFFRALTQHLQAQSQFIDCRLACIASAEAIFGAQSTEAKSTAAAFDAVEIFGAPPTQDPTPVPVVQGPDSTIFVYFDAILNTFNLGRRETAQGDNEFGSIFALDVRPTRPAVSGDGALALFVDSSFDLCIVATDDGNTRDCLGFAGLVHSVALSPDKRLVAFVLRNPDTQQPDGQINVVDVETGESKTYNLVAPSQDGIAIDAVIHADAMNFSTDSKSLVYDAVSEVRVGNAPAITRWSIYALNLATEQTSIVVPPIEGLNTGNPAFGRAGNRYLTFDAMNPANGNSGVVVLDLFTGEAGLVGTIENGAGFPVFTGDEKAVIYATRDENAVDSGFSLIRQELSTNRLAPSGDATLWCLDAPLGVTYRRGSFAGTNALPAVTLSSSVTNATAPATITLSAVATDADGTVAKVEFYSGVTRLGEATAAPYQFTWQNVPVGEYRLTARAIDNVNGAGDSGTILVQVRPAETERSRMKAEWLANRVVRLTVEGVPGEYIIEQSQDLRAWSDIYPLTVGATGKATLDDSGGPQNLPTLFYRVRRLP